jgi:hypothetical protein
MRLRILSTNLIILLATVFYPLRAKGVNLSQVSFSMLPKRTLSFSRRSLIWLHILRKPFWARKWLRRIWVGFRRVQPNPHTNLGVGFERCEDKGEKSALKFIPSSTYHKEEATIKPTKAHYPSNPKPSFNPKR